MPARHSKDGTCAPLMVVAVMLGALAVVRPVGAAIVELAREGFADAMVGETAFVEDFESYAVGPKAGPMLFSNGVLFDIPTPFVTASGVAGQVVIGNNLPLTEPHRFTSAISPSTTSPSTPAHPYPCRRSLVLALAPLAALARRTRRRS